MPTTTTNPPVKASSPLPVLTEPRETQPAKPPVRKLHLRELSILVSVILCVLVFGAMNHRFLTWGTALSVLQGAATDGLMVVGMTIIIVCGAFDLSIGSTMAAGSYLVGLLLLAGVPVPLAVLIALFLGTLIGWTNGIIITRLRINPFIATLGTMSIIRGAVLVATKSGDPTGFPTSFQQINWYNLFGIIPLPVIILVVVTILSDLALRHMRYLRQIYFVGSNETAAVLTGIPVSGVKVFAFALTGALAAAAGIIAAAKANSVDPNEGMGAELRVISAVIVGGASLTGGRGTMLGSFLGLLLMEVIKTGLIFVDVPAEAQQVAVGMVLILAAMIDQANTSFIKGLISLLTQTRSKKVERAINVCLGLALVVVAGLWLGGKGPALSASKPDSAASTGGQNTRSAQASPAGRKQKYVTICAEVGAPYWIDSKAGLEDKARELGVNASFIGPPTVDVNAQIDYVDKAIAEGVDGIIMIPMGPGCIPAINKAIEKGIPVLCADADSPESKRYSYVGTGNFNAGFQGGTQLAKLINGEGNVALVAIPGMAHLDARIAGYKAALEAYPKIKIAGILNDQGKASESQKACRAFMQSHDDVVGFGCVDAAGGEGAAVVVKELGKVGKVKIVAMDRNEATLKFIEEGVIDISIAQRTYMMTYLALQMLYDIRNDQVKLVNDWKDLGINPLPPTVDTGNILITKENVKAFYHTK